LLRTPSRKCNSRGLSDLKRIVDSAGNLGFDPSDC
jgi:hypothetical protein